MVHNYSLKICDCPMSLGVLSTHEAWIGIRRGTISALCRWRRQHTFPPNPAISWKVAFDFFRHTVGTTHSDVVKEAGQRRPRRLFRFLYQRLAGAELHRWETSSTSPRMGWSKVAPYTTALAKKCASTTQMVSAESTPQCSHRFCQTVCSASR